MDSTRQADHDQEYSTRRNSQRQQTQQIRRANQEAQRSQKIICIGDIHGHVDRLKALWSQLQQHLGDDFANYLVVFLGDFVDRGPNSKDVIEFLVQLKQTRPNTVFLAGNHDFAMAAFLGLLNTTESMRHTWDNPHIWARHEEKQGWYKGPGWEDMHLQGRRWGGGTFTSVYNSLDTFKSYGAPYGDRAALLSQMPDSHKKFLQELDYVHEIPGYIFVHAGLEDTGAGYSGQTVQEQLDSIRKRQPLPRPEPLCGREHVWSTPKELRQQSVCVVSGHHGQVYFGPYRIIMDESGGMYYRDLCAVILPSLEMISHTGNVRIGAAFEDVFRGSE